MPRPAGRPRCEKGNDDGLAVAANEWCSGHSCRKAHRLKSVLPKAPASPVFTEGRQKAARTDARCRPEGRRYNGAATATNHIVVS